MVSQIAFFGERLNSPQGQILQRPPYVWGC
jgi:hypothetical protein